MEVFQPLEALPSNGKIMEGEIFYVSTFRSFNTLNFALDSHYTCVKVKIYFQLSVYRNTQVSTSIYGKEMLPLDSSTPNVWKASIYWYSATTDIDLLEVRRYQKKDLDKIIGPRQTGYQKYIKHPT